MSLLHAFSPSGGIAYHTLARRRARSLWAPFRAVVRVWLSDWFSSVAGGELLVFGPSAGWTLPLDLFSRFSSVIFVEPDPVARLLLRRRLPASVRASFLSRADLLPWTSRGEGAFAAFLGEHAGAAVLFSNVLGQMALVSTSTRSSESLQSEFLSALQGRSWASYHDLFSGTGSGAGAVSSREPSRVFSAGDVIDHETQWLAEGRVPETALWPLTEDNLHIIDFVHS